MRLRPTCSAPRSSVSGNPLWFQPVQTNSFSIVRSCGSGFPLGSVGVLSEVHLGRTSHTRTPVFFLSLLVAKSKINVRDFLAAPAWAAERPFVLCCHGDRLWEPKGRGKCSVSMNFLLSHTCAGAQQKMPPLSPNLLEHRRRYLR